MAYDVIVIGAGLAGLTAGLELSERGQKVILIEKERFVGGRTASWNDNGMEVESGFHRHIGYYKALPEILQKVGVNINQIVLWENSMEVRVGGTKKSVIWGIAPFHAPLAFLRGLIGNNHVLSIDDKRSLLPFFLSGFRDYLLYPKKLDQYSIGEYSQKHKVSERAFISLIVPLSTGIFFLPPEDYSAKVFFGLFAPGIPRIFHMRVGAYLGGMTDVLSRPIAQGIEKLGGDIRLKTKVKQLLIEKNRVIGVSTDHGEQIKAGHTILAADLGQSQILLKNCERMNPWFRPLLRMPRMSAITIQFDLKSRSLPFDRTTFGSQNLVASFSEQSHSTFKHLPGRLSVITAYSQNCKDISDETVYNTVIADAKKIGIPLEGNIRDYRVIRHIDKFYHLGPNHDWMRPTQYCPMAGLTLAGDYTRQPFYSTMEGAVLSGIKAAKAVVKEKR
ncbi:MAG: FAD-dependent oxidoreductase [Firmicutes bacterium]|nr:FAD-dependent oxidoreductase [Bacillota bacterium]